jgi:hypothetical protein
MIRRTLSVAGLAGAIVAAGPAGAALAHECFVANRSAQGDAAVSEHSAAWVTITPEVLFTEIIPLPAPVAACAIAAWKADAALPDYIVVGGKQAVGQDGVIAENNPNFTAKGLASDGRGIDHAEDVYGAAVEAIIAGCTG